LPAGLDAALDAAAELGARWVMVNCDDDDPARAAGQLHAVAYAAARRGLRTGVEFMAYTAMASLEQACGLVRRAGHAGAAVVIDSLHLFRSGAGAADFEGRPEVARDFMQINDAWVARIPVSLAEEGRAHRLLPGEGDLPVHTLVARLDAGATLAVESPCALRRDTLTPLQRAELAMRTTRRWAQAHALPLSDASEPIT
jgi:sugar phosphate isomerase/epimerase